MENIEIRKATINDVAQLQKIGRRTFSETFSAENTKENMEKYLDECFSLEKLKDELNNNKSEFYFAILSNNIVGYLKLNTGEAQTELKDYKALEIERIYVSKEFQGKKIGQLFYEKAIQVATQLNASYVWLGVWEKNSKAISFYKKNGFVEFDKHSFKLGDDEQTDIMMKKNINIHNKPGIHIEGIQVILPVKDMNVSRAFYKDILGFEEAEWGTDDFTSMNRENAGIYLTKVIQEIPGTWLWIGFDGDIFKLYDELKAKGVKIKLPPTNYSWAMEMHIEDPDGHVLRFGTDPDSNEPFLDNLH